MCQARLLSSSFSDCQWCCFFDEIITPFRVCFLLLMANQVILGLSLEYFSSSICRGKEQVVMALLLEVGSFPVRQRTFWNLQATENLQSPLIHLIIIGHIASLPSPYNILLLEGAYNLLPKLKILLRALGRMRGVTINNHPVMTGINLAD